MKQPATSKKIDVDIIKKRMGWSPPNFGIKEVRALQALDSYAKTGENPPSASDCHRALDWIIRGACAYHQDPFRPDTPGGTDYMSGRRAVGVSILTLLGLKPGMIDFKEGGNDE